MIITPEMIPHSLFHKGSWLSNPVHPAWYYFMEQAPMRRGINRSILSSVDQPLKELVAFFQSLGIITTPSCSGHDYTDERFKEVYDQLLQDGELIRNKGLILHDPETNGNYCYADHFYKLPWSKKIFLDKIREYQRKGVIGFMRMDASIMKIIAQLKYKWMTTGEQNNVFYILTTESSKYSISEKWEKITADIKNILRRPQSGIITG